jgi:hypothetical protein
MNMPWDNFTPMTDEDIQNELEERQKDFLLEEGVYDIKVEKCIERQSKSGNDMFEISISIENPKGKNRTVFEYLLHDQKWMHKLKSVCDCLDMKEAYNKGSISCADFELKKGKAHVERSNDKLYGWKNKISKYIPSGEVVEDASAEIIDDDLPF